MKIYNLLPIILVSLISFSANAESSRAQSAYDNQDYWEAMRLWQQESDLGDAEAAFNIGRLYDHGLGVRRDEQMAATWFQTAAKRGNAKAQYMLGLILSEQGSDPETLRQAIEWLRRAAVQGEPKSVRLLKELEARLNLPLIIPTVDTFSSDSPLQSSSTDSKNQHHSDLPARRKKIFFLYTLIAGLISFPLVRHTFARWYAISSFPTDGTNPMEILLKQIGLRLPVELLVFSLSCVFGAAGGWVFGIISYVTHRPRTVS
jgi:hypothetical protein